VATGDATVPTADASEGDTGLGSNAVPGPDAAPAADTGASGDAASTSYTVGVTVTGLAPGGTLVLQDNGSDDLSATANGALTFAMPIASGSPYVVTILTQPAGQMCAVSGGAGLVGAANVTGVVINCASNTYTIGGTITGLSGTIVLQDNDGDDLSITSDGVFTFASPVVSGGAYVVSVLTQPASPVVQTCSVTMATGTVASANVTSVVVSCSSSTFSVGGTVTGLAAGGSVTLEDNGVDNVTVSADGSFAFPSPVASGAPYAVTILTQPSGVAQTCTVTMGAGTVGTGGLSSVVVNCVTASFTVGGTVNGLSATATIVLEDNGGDAVTLSADGPFAFPTSLPSGTAYTVSVSTQPAAPAQTCSVSAGTGTVNTGNVANVVVNCAANTFTVGGTVSGLALDAELKLQDNGGNIIFISSNGAFAFPSPLGSGEAYDITVASNPNVPVSETCTVAAGMGTVTSGDVSTADVTCTTNTFAVGGTVSGLVPNSGGVTLTDNGGNQTTITQNGAFTFTTPIVSGTGYSVVAVNPTYPPAAQSCVLANQVGTVGNAPLSNLTVTCTTRDFAVGGTVSFANSVSPSPAITLQFTDNPAVTTPLTVTLTPSTAGFPGFGFAPSNPAPGSAGVPSGSTYTVSIASQPPHQACSFAGGATTATAMVPGAAVTSLNVTCQELNGGVCTAGGQCQNSNCEGNLCCDSACTATPQNTCGPTGACNAGGSGCANWGSGTPCLAASCVDGANSSIQTAVSTCTGGGACAPGAITSCGTFKCGGVACKTACQADTDCSTGNYCGGGVCIAAAAAGAACTAVDQCTTGLCGTGGTGSHCCAAQCGPAGGTCGATDCDATGACVYPTTSCSLASCSGSTFTPAGTCNGQGGCAPGTPAPCAGGLACGSGTACLTHCSADGDCASNSLFCSNPGPTTGTCVSRAAAGSACAANDACSSGLCGPSGAGTRCCAAACGATGAACGATDCDAAGACVFPSATTSCGAAACTGSTLTTGGTCNGSGSCSAGSAAQCPSGLACNAGGTGCLTACASSSDCAGGGTCTNPGASGTCGAAAPVGGLSNGSYNGTQLWDVQRSPAFPSAGQSITLSSFNRPYTAGGMHFTVAAGQYVTFTPVAGTCSGAADIVETLYNQDGTVNEVLSASGQVWGLANAGFLYTSTSGFGTLVTNTPGYVIGDSLTYTATTGLATCAQLAAY
jgi:hypothetical protein